LTEELLKQLISLSEAWETENCCHGYIKNTPDDIKGNRVFVAFEDSVMIGYLFGHKEVTEKTTSVYQIGTKYFEIEELYVKPAFRGRGIGKRLFRYVEREVADEVDMIMLGTATKNFRAILHFYIDELGMEFWSARLFKKLR
ncbi:MAG: GNAT family N-acetyltransferase, partial [Lachnospiraceae bacterium]|nr:GNAT family N-acetyltransferase [Lachnospiraceae bacterium]